MHTRTLAALLASLMTLASIPSPTNAQEPDWTAARQETLAHLQAMIRMNTVNPPGNELQVARYLDSTLKAAGIETHLFEPTPGRGALVARIKGNGSKQPVLIMGHMDVVGVERAHWTVDPFAAEIKGDYLYGRGAIDDKGMLAANLETMLLLKRHVVDKGGTLSRDVIFVANSDEETSGEWGMGWLIGNHPELIKAECALNEGGRVRTHQADITAEEPFRLLLNPCTDRPAEHLTFDDQGLVHPQPDAHGQPSEKGRISIAVYALQRKRLVEERLRVLDRLRFQLAQLNHLVPHHSRNDGYSLRSFTRASSVVNFQLAPTAA